MWCLVQYRGLILIQCSQPYIEPHFNESTSPSTDGDFYALVAARWSEYRAERYLQSSGHTVSSNLPTPETRVNTPVQLFLAYSRIARARVEIRVYSELLGAARPALLAGECYFFLFRFFCSIMYDFRIRRNYEGINGESHCHGGFTSCVNQPLSSGLVILDIIIKYLCILLLSI